MKLVKTINKIVEEAKLNYESACEKGDKQEKIDLLERRYYDSLRLLKMFESDIKKIK